MSADWFGEDSGSKRSRKPLNWDNDRLKWVLGAVAAIALVVLIFSPVKNFLTGTFGSINYKAKGVCEIVIDRTGSTSSDSVSQHFRRLAISALDACGADHSLVDIWTTGTDGVNPTLINNRPISLIYAGSTLQYYVDRETSSRNRAKRAIATVFESSGNSPSYGSDIVSALSQAAKTGFEQSNRNGGIPNRVIVITDGMQLSQGTAVTTMSSIDSDPNLLARQAQGLYSLVGLSGANVYFYGVLGGTLDSTGQPLPAWFENKVRSFWKDLVILNGGVMCSYQNDQSSSAFLACGGN
jgi:hypothetical protein